MPDLRFSEIEDNNYNNTNNNISRGLSRNEQYNNTPKNPLKRTHTTSQNNIFGLISQNESNSYNFENGSGSSTVKDLVQNGEFGTVNYGEQDLTYYDWPSIDNFEDVDRLFRNSDSTFGQTQMMEESEIWGNDSDAIYASEMEVLHNNSSNNSTQIKDAHTWKQESSVDEIMQELIDQKCSLISPFEQNQKQPFKSSPSSYVTFDSFSPMQTAGGKELENLKNGPLSPGPICKSQFERVSGEQKGKIDSSTEETSFRQLQNVINQLDEKTKICIRDSLYRLAGSVQQRTCCYNGDSAMKFGEATRNLESETNPVDRSIAELLFHHSTNNEDSMSLNSSISVTYFVNT